MAVKTFDLDDYIMTIDDKTGVIKTIQKKKECLLNKKLETKKILERKENYKLAGQHLVIPEYINVWNEFIDSSLGSDYENIWEYGTIIEGTLECMKLLSENAEIKDVYSRIDYINSNIPCIICNKEINLIDNYSITQLISKFHKRGSEFCKYRNEHLKKDNNIKCYIKK